MYTLKPSYITNSAPPSIITTLIYIMHVRAPMMYVASQEPHEFNTMVSHCYFCSNVGQALLCKLQIFSISTPFSLAIDPLPIDLPPYF